LALIGDPNSLDLDKLLEGLDLELPDLGDLKLQRFTLCEDLDALLADLPNLT